MMSTIACLAIGVGDAPPLDYLRGAVNGATAIAGWSMEQGFTTRLLTDERTPVGRGDVAAVLEALLAEAPQTLVLYFAGHGLSRAASDDLWLLSHWESEEKAVSVNGLRDRLSRHGLRRLIIISDACRSPLDVDTQTIEGDSLLGRGPFDEDPPQLDLWYSASRGRAAFMVPGRRPEETRCIFSGLLAEALAGVHELAFDPDDPVRPITSFRLADFLEAEVPARAARYGTTLKPVITTGIRPPNNRYRAKPPPVAPNLPPWPEPGDLALAKMGATSPSGRITPPPGASWSTFDTAPAPSPAPLRSFAPARIATFASATVALVVVGSLSLYSVMLSPPTPVASAPRPPLSVDTAPTPPRLAPPEPSFLDASAFSLSLALLCAVLLSLAVVWWWRRSGRMRRGSNVEANRASNVEAKQPPLDLDALIAQDAARVAEADSQHAVRASLLRLCFDAERRPDHFETGAGLTLTGASASRVLTGGRAEVDSFDDGHTLRLNPPVDASQSPFWRGSIPLKAPMPLLVELSNGDWAGTVAIPDFVHSLGIRASGVETALFRAMYQPANPAAEDAIARLAACGLATEQLPEVMRALRVGKHVDPMMGVLAAWLFHATGDTDSIRRIAFYLAERGQPIPFDIALVGRLAAWRGDDGLPRVSIPAIEESGGWRATPDEMRIATPAAEALLAGGFPLMRQGWALLNPEGRRELYPAGLSDIARHLRPATFTTLDPQGGRKLAVLLFPTAPEV